MAVLGGNLDLLVDHRLVCPVLFLLRGTITITRKSGTDKAAVTPSVVVVGLKCRCRIAILYFEQMQAYRRAETKMTQTNNRFFDEIGRLMNDAAGAAQGVKREVDAVVRNQAEKILRDLDIVKREEFEAVKDMARLAREENEALKARIAALEAKSSGSN
jgi:BMFP domain-containing protein YqiC